MLDGKAACALRSGRHEAMTKARQPEVLNLGPGPFPAGLSDAYRQTCEQAGLRLPEDRNFRAGLNVLYPDRRIMPRICERTRMRRDYCCCSPCRTRRRRNHRASCSCWLCFSDRVGKYVDDLGGRTAAGAWKWFVTLTFRTKDFPWARGFPIEQPQPHPDFVHHFFDRKMIPWIGRQVHGPVEYFVADQFGEIGRRLHLHCGLSWPGLFEYRWKDLQDMLWKGAGFNRILPWGLDAGYYIGRYIGRDAARCEWNFRVGSERAANLVPTGKHVVAVSPAVDHSSIEYKRTLARWHR